MKLSSERVVVGAFLVCLLHVHSGEARGPSTQEERAKAVAFTRSLEQDPFAENAPTTRQWLREWIAEVPDIRFKVCDDLVGHALGDNYPYSQEIKLQVLFSGAALTLERQDKARDDIAIYTAGIEGALRAYEIMATSKPDAKLAFLDDLVVKRDKGELVNHIAGLAKEQCPKPKRDLILPLAPLAGAAVGTVLGLLVARWFGGRRAEGVAAEGPVAARKAKIFRGIVFICAAYYVIIGIALHFLEPEYDPRYKFMSDYSWSAHGWLMTTTFFVLALAAFTVAAGLRDVHPSRWSARIGFGVLAVGAPFVCLAGVFKGFPLHEVASAVALPSFTLAVLLLSWSFRQASGWQTIYPATLLIALGMLAALLSFMAFVGLPGLQQRAFLFLFLLWLAVVSHWLVRVKELASPNKALQ